MVLAALVALAACSKDTTYADQKKAERSAIENFINSSHVITFEGDTLLAMGPITTIDDVDFYGQDSTTDVSRNEYVYFGSSGVYMQIVRKGVGNKIESGQTKRIIARYFEYNIMADSVQSLNTIVYYSTTPDLLSVANTYGTFTASFITDNGGGAMYRLYNNTEVPSGWLAPFPYIRVGRQINEGDQISKVRLIVPHSQGTANARSNVQPFFYEITFQEMRD